MDRHNDVRFRGKAIDDLTREEAIEALRQALSQVKSLEFMDRNRLSPRDLLENDGAVPGWHGQQPIPANFKYDQRYHFPDGTLKGIRNPLADG